MATAISFQLEVINCVAEWINLSAKLISHSQHRVDLILRKWKWVLNNHFEQTTERVNCRFGSHRNKIVGEKSCWHATRFCVGCTNGPIGHATELLTIGARIFFSNFEEFYAFKWIPGEYVDIHLWAAWGWMLGNAFEGKHAKTRTIWDGRGTEVGSDHRICTRQHFSSSHCEGAKVYWEKLCSRKKPCVLRMSRS